MIVAALREGNRHDTPLWGMEDRKVRRHVALVQLLDGYSWRTCGGLTVKVRIAARTRKPLAM
jgi:hypothetical protein